MYQKFKWTHVSEERNRLLKQYEPLQLFLFYEFAKALTIDSFIDVGANVGTYSIIVSSLHNVKAVHAFEPSPRTFEELRQNVQLNEHAKQKVAIYKKAVSNTAGEATFGIVSDYSGANSIMETSIHDAAVLTNRVTVERISLDEVVHLSSKAIGLKIDVEGHEKEVLYGAKNLLCNNKAIVQLEDYSGRNANVQNILRNCGYERILVIGPDNYFTNVREVLTDKAVLRACEDAARDLIEDNLETESAERPIRVNLLSGLNFEISGKIANLARTARNALRRH